MSNGLKVGLLIVIAGALGFLAYSQLSKSDEIGSRPIENVSNNAGGPSIAQNNGNISAASDAAKDPTKAVGVASNERAKTTLTYDKTIHDFGTLTQGDKVECSFRVTNTGSEPLIIEDAKGSCGCTVPDYPKEPIPPGVTKEIKVKFDSTGKKDNQQKTVTLTANTDPIQSILTIKAFVNGPADGGKQEASKH
jgi:hypothetical protein